MVTESVNSGQRQMQHAPLTSSSLVAWFLGCSRRHDFVPFFLRATGSSQASLQMEKKCMLDIQRVVYLVSRILPELAWYNHTMSPVSLACLYFFSLRTFDLQDLLLRGHLPLSTCTDRSERSSMTCRSKLLEADQSEFLLFFISPESESIVRSQGIRKNCHLGSGERK